MNFVWFVWWPSILPAMAGAVSPPFYFKSKSKSKAHINSRLSQSNYDISRTENTTEKGTTENVKHGVAATRPFTYQLSGYRATRVSLAPCQPIDSAFGAIDAGEERRTVVNGWCNVVAVGGAFLLPGIPRRGFFPRSLTPPPAGECRPL